MTHVDAEFMVVVVYRNWKGALSTRLIRPYTNTFRFGTNKYHREVSLLFECWDYGKEEERTFSMNGVVSWRPYDDEQDNHLLPNSSTLVVAFDPMRVDVEALLRGLRINAKDESNKWRARCPSKTHDDRRPSWTIVDIPGHEKHGVHECRACHFHGTSFDLVSHVFDIGNFSAVEWILKNAYGKIHAIPDIRIQVASPTLSRACVLPFGVVFEPFSVWPHPIRSYALSRGITAEQVARWGLGYAVDGRLAGRIVFPARNNQGIILGYSARSFAGSPIRYLAPAENETPVPSAIFGEQYWPPHHQRDAVVVLEGAINGLAVEREVSLPFACIHGSQVNVEQLAKLSTFQRAIVLTDPDPAGDRAAEMLEGSLLRHLGVTRVRLPFGYDAESYQQRSGAGSLRDRICS